LWRGIGESEFAAAIKEARPFALHVADRWHVAKNLTEHLENRVSARWKRLTKAAGEAEMPPEPIPLSPSARRPRQPVGEARYQQMLALKEAGLSTGAIARRLGVRQRTIQHWLAQQHGPYAGPRKPRPEGARLVDTLSAGALGGGRTQRHGSVGGVEGQRLHNTLAAVCIGAWPNGASIHASVDCLLRLSQSLARPWKT
jgi:Homeodomain-like domain